MTEVPTTYHWTPDGFVRAWAAGAFNGRVELIEGEVWTVVIGGWHGFAVLRVAECLPRKGFRKSNGTLPTAGSLPDPDCWIVRANAEPIGKIGARIDVWDSKDVPLVIEISDETVVADLNVKSKLYARGGYAVYWVITKDAVYEHTEPRVSGYAVVRKFLPGERIPVRYADTDIAVDDLLFDE
ncbi:hypothetical protein D5S18_16620 [Nocardia panacis]|uniref:Putative restriction endonuclease domain-containing protein n=1 Tax=Nocardia panacis TaxID=2340916 RepID=A0A3A4KZS0_9NOCA|nr:Uma2 family endonuclease [Nocardia panacis]RJO75017.1 hypothetical protein D5S18_16620 [Nocardia panacis]